MDDSNADYLTKYREFIESLLKTTDLDYPLPVNVANYNIAEFEIAGEVLNWCLQYLNERSCPNSLAVPLCCKVLEEIRLAIKQDPESCGYRTREDDFQPLKLMQLTIRKLVDVCVYYSDNAKLSTLLPPPSSLLLDPLVSFCGIKNYRRKMEDRHVAIQDLHSLFNIKDCGTASYYAIFDGHNGIDAAVYSSCHVHQYLVESSHYPHNPELALREAFRRTDDRFVDKSNKEKLDSGTTALCALLRPNESMLYVAWLGDSQAILVSQGKAYQLVKPHRPDQPEERTRIREMGGSVMFVGTWRVDGHLAVSRAIGNRKYKQYVVGDPDVRVIPLTGKEEFLVLASDGLWDYVPEIDVVNAVYDYLQENKGDVKEIAKELVRLAKSRISQDNVSVVVVFLSEPKPFKGGRMEASEVERIWRDEEVVDSSVDYVQNCLSHFFPADAAKAKALVAQSQTMEEWVPKKIQPNQKKFLKTLPWTYADVLKRTSPNQQRKKDIVIVDTPLILTDDKEMTASKKIISKVEDLKESSTKTSGSISPEVEIVSSESKRIEPEETGNEEAPDAEVDSADESEEEWNYIPGVDGKATTGGRIDKKPQVVEVVPEKTHQGDGEEDDEDDMSRLNPNAAEFVPVLGAEVDVVLACSPGKGQERSLENVQIPKQKDFLDEILTKPAEIDNSGYEFDPCEVSVNGVNSSHKPVDEESDNSMNDSVEQIELLNTSNHLVEESVPKRIETDFFGFESTSEPTPELSDNTINNSVEQLETPKTSNPFAQEIDDPIQSRMVTDYFGDGLEMDLKQFDPMQNSMIILGSTSSPTTPEDNISNFVSDCNFVSEPIKEHVSPDANNVNFDSVKVDSDSCKVDLVPESTKPDLVCPVDESPDVIEESRDNVDVNIDFGKCDLIASVPSEEPTVESPTVEVNQTSNNPFVDELIEAARTDTMVYAENCSNQNVDNEHTRDDHVDLLNKDESNEEPIVKAADDNELVSPSHCIVEEVVSILDNVDLNSTGHSENAPVSIERLVDEIVKDDEESVEAIQFNFTEAKSDGSSDLDPVRHQFGFDGRISDAVPDALDVFESKTKDESGDSDGFEIINYNEQSKPQLNGVDHSEETDRSPDNYKIDELVHEIEIPIDNSSKAMDEDFIVEQIMQEVETGSSEFYPGINSVHLTYKMENEEGESHSHELETVVEGVEGNVIPKTEFMEQAEPTKIDTVITEELHSGDRIQETLETTLQCEVETHLEPKEEISSLLEEQVDEAFLEKDIEVDVLVEADPINMGIQSTNKTENESAAVEILPEIVESKDFVQEVAPSAPLVEDLLKLEPVVVVEEKEVILESEKSSTTQPTELPLEVVEKSALIDEKDVVVEVSTPPSTPAPIGLLDAKEDMIAAAAAAVGVATVAAAASVLTAEVKTPTENKALAKKTASIKTDAKSPTKPSLPAKSPTKVPPGAAKPSMTGVAAKKPAVSATATPKTPPAKTVPLKTTATTKPATPKTGIAPAKPSSPAAKPMNGVAAKPKPATTLAAKAPLTKTTAKPLTSATKTAPTPAKAPLTKPKTPTTTVPPIKKPTVPTVTKTTGTTAAKKPEPSKPATTRTTTTSALKPSLATSSRPLSAAKPAVKSTVSTTKTLTPATNKPAPITKPALSKTTAAAPSRTVAPSKTLAAPTAKTTAKPAAPKPKPAAPTTLKKPSGVDGKTVKDASNKLAPAKVGPIKRPPGMDSKSKALAKSETGDVPLTQEPVVSTTTNGHVNGNVSDDSPIDINPPVIAEVPAVAN